jgi:hypothetical protein
MISAATRDIFMELFCSLDASFSEVCVTKANIIISTVIRSPSASTIYRHHTPPKELPQFTQHNSNGNGNGNPDSDFVVHRSKGITTLFNMGEALIPAKLRQAKEKTNNDSKAEERGEHRDA